MALLKKYPNFSGRKTMELAIIFIISIIVISYGLFFYLQNNTENNIRNSLFEQQKQRQIGSALALSQHIGSDLDSIMARLQDLANTVYLQQGDLFSNTTKKSMEQMYVQMNNITKVDRLIILDENNIARSSIVPNGEEAFVGINFSYRDWVTDTKNTLIPIFSNGFEGRDGKYRIAITHPITNIKTGKYIGLVAALIPTTEFFAHYGNIYNIKSDFLVVFDKKGNYIATPRTQLLGKNYFGNESQQIFHYNPLQYNLYSQLLGGQPGYAVYDFGIGERLNTGYPVFVQGKPTYFVSAVTPTSVIYSQINNVILTQRIETFSLLAGTTAAIVVLIIFLIKWSSNLNEEVKRRTTELNESNMKLELANEKLKAHDKMQKEFINVAAHELKTPIQPIISLAEHLKSSRKLGLHEDVYRISSEGQLQKQQQRDELIDVIIRNARRLRLLAENILDVTKIETQSLFIKKERFSLNNLILNTIIDSRNQITRKNKDIKLEFISNEESVENEHTDNIFVDADKDRISQVISNLLSNAIKFTDEGAVSINLIKKEKEKGKDNNQEVIVSIKDTGTGIDSEILPRLFTKFTTKSDRSGTGLGLFISKSIVEAHGGRIWAENNYNEKGATFYFSLPLSR
jgi:signal transduction histidine kinase